MRTTLKFTRPVLSAVIVAFGLVAVKAMAGDVTADNLVVCQDAVLYGNLTVAASVSVPTNGLILYYSFSTNTAIVPDDSGNSHTGIVTGATWVTGGQSGGAYSFDGTNDSIETTFQPVTGSNSWSVSLWFKTTKAAGELFLWKMGTESFGWNTAYAGISYDEDAVGLDCWGGWIKRAYDYSVRDGEWHHYLVVNNGSEATLWLDGTDAGNDGDGSTTSLNLGTGYFAVGRRPSAAPAPWQGQIDEVRIYNRALLSTEVQALYLNERKLTAGAVTFETGVKYVKPLGDLSMGIYTNSP